MGRVKSCRLVCAGYLGLARGCTGTAPSGYSVVSLAVECPGHQQSSPGCAQKYISGADRKAALPPADRGTFPSTLDTSSPVTADLPGRRGRAYLEYVAVA